MSRAIFTQADGVVGEHEDGTLLHQRSHAHGVAAIFHEDQEGRAVGHETAVQGDAVHDRSHAEFTDTVIDVVTAGIFLGQTLGVGPDSQVGTGEVSRAAHQFRQQRAIGVQGVLGGFAGSHGLAFVLAFLDVRLGFLGEIGGQVTGHATLELSRQFRLGLLVGRKLLLPLGLRCRTFLTGVPGTGDVGRNFERTVLPAQLLAGQGDFVVTQGGTVTAFLALFVRGTKADDGLAADQRGLFGVGTGGFDRGANGVSIMAVDCGNHLPAVRLETLRGVISKPAVNFAIDGDAVVVVEEHKLAEAQGACQGSHFVGDTFHEAAVAEERIGVVINNLVARTVELRCQGLLGNGETNGVGNALAEGAGGRFNARGVAIFGMARGLGVQLTEILDVVDGNVVTAQVQQGVLQHGAVTVGQHEAVPVGPLRVGRVVAQVIVPQYLGDIRHTHGRTRVAGLGFLNRIHAQRANGVGEIFTRRH